MGGFQHCDYDYKNASYNLALSNPPQKCVYDMKNAYFYNLFYILSGAFKLYVDYKS